MEEIWRPVDGYEGLYEVSSFGNVRSLRTNKILKQRPSHFGYVRAHFSVEGNVKDFYIHTLVAKAFIPNPLSKPQVNHKDGNKHNNYVNNLEWVTASENTKHAYSNGLAKAKSGESHYKSKWSQADIDYIRELYASGKYTQAQLCEMFDMSAAHMSRIVRRLKRT